MSPIYRLLTRCVLPLLLAALVLLAQSLLLTHRVAHPVGDLRATLLTAESAASTTQGVLDILFDHRSNVACDDFDAALGQDVNPGSGAPASPPSVAACGAPLSLAQRARSFHPVGLSLARAPPHA